MDPWKLDEIFGFSFEGINTFALALQCYAKSLALKNLASCYLVVMYFCVFCVLYECLERSLWFCFCYTIENLFN